LSRAKPGPKPTGKGRQTGLRIPKDLDRALDQWIGKQEEQKLTKPEAIRRLLWRALRADYD
jgi:hypothetical protein